MIKSKLEPISEGLDSLAEKIFEKFIKSTQEGTSRKSEYEFLYL
jgi:hypothetical protein